MNYQIDRWLSGFIKNVSVITRFATVHKSRILIPTALRESNPRPPCTPLKPSGAFSTCLLESPNTNKYSSGETVEMLLSKALYNQSSTTYKPVWGA